MRNAVQEPPVFAPVCPCSPVPEPLLTWGMQSSSSATATLLFPGTCMDQRKTLTHTKSSPTSEISVSAWHEAEKKDLFPFQCFLCCQHHILLWPCSRLHLGLIITARNIDSGCQSFSINSFVIDILKSHSSSYYKTLLSLCIVWKLRF